jgi:SNF2 family DNA or RNA helicase
MGKVQANIVSGPRGDRIGVKSPWRPNASQLAKLTPGASWRADQKIWSYPLSMTTCFSLRKVYGDDLEIGADLWKWAARQNQEQLQLSELAQKYDADLHNVPRISPVLNEAMASRTYQRSGAAFIAQTGNALLADEPSMGKTLTALAAIMERPLWYGRHLVVAPVVSLEPTWARQIRQWGGPGVGVFVCSGSKAKRDNTIREFMEHDIRDAPSFLVVNPEMVRVKVEEFCDKCGEWRKNMSQLQNQELYHAHMDEKHKTKKVVSEQKFPQLTMIPWQSVIVDECHDIFAAARPSNITQVVEGMSRIPSKMRIGLTGTPMRGREVNLWGVLDWLGAIPGGFWAWIDTYFEKDHNGFGVEIGGLREEMRPVFGLFLDRHVLRRTKKEVRDDLPENNFVDVWVEADPKQRKILDEFTKMGEVALESGSLSAVGVLAELTRLRQLAFGVWDIDVKEWEEIYQGVKVPKVWTLVPKSSPKLDWLIQALHDRGVTGKPKDDWRSESGGHKYVIGSQFTQVVDFVEAELNKIGITTAKVTGSVTGKKRDEAVRAFDQDEDGPRVMLINTKAGGVSIDLDTYCDEMFILDETFVEDDQTQLRGRIDNRKGEVRPRTFHYIRTLGTIEQGLAETNIGQANMQAELMDGRRGIEIALRILKGM